MLGQGEIGIFKIIELYQQLPHYDLPYQFNKMEALIQEDVAKMNLLLLQHSVQVWDFSQEYQTTSISNHPTKLDVAESLF